MTRQTQTAGLPAVFYITLQTAFPLISKFHLAKANSMFKEREEAEGEGEEEEETNVN